MKLFSFKAKKIRGYIYSSLKDDKRFSGVKEGSIIQNIDNTPPWIVVDHLLENVLITQWPGKLFEVEIINLSKEKYLNKGLVKDVSYTRTLGVQIIRELSVDNLFGLNGNSISQIIDVTRNISQEEVTYLSNYNIDEAREIYSQAWKKWIRLTGESSPYLEEDHFDTLEILNQNQKNSSPINHGLSIIASHINLRAKEVLGENAVTIDEDGEVNLNSLWAEACERLLHAGMSFESNDLLSPTEKEILLLPWRKVFGK